MPRRFIALVPILMCASFLRAHTVPTITVEAEFAAARRAVLKVNLDPRLFLSAQPTTLPPVAASWWVEQDEAARAKSVGEAIACVERFVVFRVGDTRIPASWKVTAIDSSSGFPLGPNTAEVHLLAEHQGPLPAVAGEFKVTLENGAPVGLILLNSREGKAERHPQAIFPGETSRGFKLPEIVPHAEERPSAVAKPAPAPGAVSVGRQAWLVPVVVALSFVLALRCRILAGIALVAIFRAAHLAAAAGVRGGWLPEAPWGMQVAGWLALAAGLHFAWGRRLPPAVASLAVAGFCQGLNLAHGAGTSLMADAAWLAAVQTAVLALGGVAVRRMFPGWGRSRG